LVIRSTISRYKIVEELGEGGVGIVYKAEDAALEGPADHKFLGDHLLNEAEARHVLRQLLQQRSVKC